MEIKNTKKGFALLVSVIFMSVMLTLGLALSSLSYKQEMLASSAIESQYAFYASDAALECALYEDQQKNLFDYASHDGNNPPSVIKCDNSPATQISYAYDLSQLSVTERISLDSNKHCADVTIYKINPQTSVIPSTYIFSQGYDVSCDVVNSPIGARFVSRGESSSY